MSKIKLSLYKDELSLITSALYSYDPWGANLYLIEEEELNEPGNRDYQAYEDTCHDEEITKKHLLDYINEIHRNMKLYSI